MKFKIIPHFSKFNKKELLYCGVECPFCKKQMIDLLMHFTRSKCGIKFVELVLKGKKNEIAGRKEALLNGWNKQ